MKPNELRIGNIVTVNNPKYHPKLKDVSLRVTGIYEMAGYIVNLEHINQEPNTYYENYSQNIDFVVAIPLTAGLLLKCGFVRYRQLYMNKAVIIHRHRDRTLFYRETQLRSLHQLQNLYYALTGEEIDVKL